MIELSAVNNMRELVATAKDQYADNVFLQPMDDTFPAVSYAELNVFVDKLHVYLQQQGISANDKVVVLIDNTSLHGMLFMSLIAVDRIYIPINANAAKAEIAEILKVTQADAVIYGGHLQDNLPLDVINDYHDCVLCVDDEADFYRTVMTIDSADEYTSSAKKEDLAEIVFTSGSTGLPKGVLLSHEAILNNSISLARRYQLVETDKLLTAVPLFHCGGQMFTTMSPVWVGAQTTIVNAQVALMRFWDIAVEQQITWSIVITAFLPVLASGAGDDRNVIKGLLVGGSAVAAEVVNNFEQKFAIPTYQVYGMTELAAVCISEPMDRTKRIAGTTGTPIDICDLRIVDSDGNNAEIGEHGEIYMSGANMFSGYMNNPEATADKMAGEYIKSGDVGFIDEQGNLNVLDRIDNMFNVGSENVYPAEIERVGSKLSGILDLQIVPIKNAVTDNDIVMVYQLQPEAEVDAAQWERTFREQLSHYKIPKYTLSLADLGLEDWPHTGSGKISRNGVQQSVDKHFSQLTAARA